MAKSSLRLSQNQRLALTPAMRQSLSVLQLPAEALVDLLQREADENPFLVLSEGRIASGAAFPGGAELLPGGPESLYAALLRQIGLLRIDAAIAEAARLIASELREDGYLDLTLETLAVESGFPLLLLEAGLAALQCCEPAGVGARTLRECLTLQLADTGLPAATAKAAIDRLDDFANARWQKLSRELGMTFTAVRELGERIRVLRAVPVEPPAETLRPRIPDLIVDIDPGAQVRVRLNPAAMPSCRALPVGAGAAGREDLAALGERATRLASAVAARGETLLQIGRHIAAVQRGFFRGESPSLVPLRQREAAVQLSMHPSTLSRAIRDKSLVTGGIVHPLRLFFQVAMPGPEGALSAFDVQQKMRQLVAAEDPCRPLADEVIAAQLQKEGVDIARRTVAKYRKWMRIPPSFARRRRKDA